MVPRLTTAPTGPLQDLERRLLDRAQDTEEWLRSHGQAHALPFYLSVVLRNAGFKLAPVDTDLFPGGFTLSSDDLPLCVQALRVAVERLCVGTTDVLLIADEPARDARRLQNLLALERLLRQAGFGVRIGTLLPNVRQPMRVPLDNGEVLVLEAVERHGRRVGVNGFEPGVLVLVDDLPVGPPVILQDIDQPIAPLLAAGAYNRRSTHYFELYSRVARDFAAHVGIDAWSIGPYFEACEETDLERDGEARLQSGVASVLERTQRKYDEYGIADTPFAIVRSDARLHGTREMIVRDPDEIVALHRAQRNMDAPHLQSVIIQEGVPSGDALGDVAGDVVHMIDRFVVGGSLPMHGAHGLVARLAQLAAAIEIEELDAQGIVLMPSRAGGRVSATP
jgi:glutamate--cysteine ligase